MEPVQLPLANVTQAKLSSAPIVGFKSGPICLMAGASLIEENLHILFY